METVRTILLVEDEPKLNQMIREAIHENFGGSINVASFLACDPAVSYLEDNVGIVNLVITCRLPHTGNSGRLLEECRKLNPDLPVILHTAVVCRDKFSAFDDCIEKQSGFSPLIEAISRMLKIQGEALP